jgi:hypothetical protein
MDFVIKDQLDTKGEVVDKLIVVTKYNPVVSTRSLTELRIELFRLTKDRDVLQAQIDELNLLIGEVEKLG